MTGEANREVKSLLRNQGFEELIDNADQAASYCRSIGEAAYRGDALTVGVHLKQLRALVVAMIKTFKEDVADGRTRPEQRDHREPMVKISDPAMEWHEVNLNDLLACCRRELAFRQRCYPRWIDKGTISAAKAEKELELMRTVVDFMTHCLFKAVTRNAKALG